MADRLDELGQDYAFVGWAIVNLLLDHPAFAPVRPTDDVDVILGLVAAQPYSEVGQTSAASGSRTTPGKERRVAAGRSPG